MNRKLLEKNNVYQNKELEGFITSLEDRYNIVNEVDKFKDLVNFSGNKNSPYHDWFKYREGFSHGLVNKIINSNYLEENEFILDPFCGSGTAVVEAALKGYHSFGIDINPMSSFITNVKSNSYNKKEINKIEEYISDFLTSVSANKNINVNNYEDVLRYFKEEKLKALISIKKQIEKIEENKIKNLFLLGYLAIIEKASDRKRDGNGLRIKETKISDVRDFYIEKMRKIKKDILFYSIDNNLNNEAKTGNAINLNKHVKEFSGKYNLKAGMILYSPPYANSFNYFQSYKLELRLGGFVDKIKEIKELKKEAIYSFVASKKEPSSTNKYIKELAKEIKNAIPKKEKKTGKRDSRTRKVPDMIKGYFGDMEKVMAESARVLNEGGKCYIVVDQSSYLGIVVPTDLLLASLAEKYGFEVEEIKTCREATTSPQQLSKYPYLNDILRESIVVLKNK